MVARTFSATLQGVDGVLVEIEASCQRALPKIQITGLPSEIIRESRERVKACLIQLGFDVPSSHALVHLSPAHARKQGSHFDLPIAVSLLVAEGLLDGARIRQTAFLGELRLDGRIAPVTGMLALLERLEREPGVSAVVIPSDSAADAGLIGSQKARLAAHLGETIDFLRGAKELPGVTAVDTVSGPPPGGPSIDEVIGQPLAKRALEIAIAGGHHLLFVGPPGVGKSLLASCVPSLLPPLEKEEQVAVMKNFAHCPQERPPPRARPFRTPHHTISTSAFLGGGAGEVIPGEVTLAHHGVLFLDEFPEFRKDALEGLREPLQNGAIHLHRVGQAMTLPARFTLLAAMNPCPCGFSMGGAVRCRCPRERLMNYRRRVSGPMLDRFDLGVVVAAPRAASSSTAAVEVRARILRSRERRRCRPRATLTEELPRLSSISAAWIRRVTGERQTSFRSLGKVLAVARTIADLEGVDDVALEHVQEAWSFRCTDLLSTV